MMSPLSTIIVRRFVRDASGDLQKENGASRLCRREKKKLTTQEKKYRNEKGEAFT
jgi:hypothetical protein